MYKIEKGIKVAPSQSTKYPFREMEVGDSFYVENKKMRAGIYGAARRHSMKVAIRNEKTGIRVWRIK